MPANPDINCLRELATRVGEIAAKPCQDERRRLWCAFHRLRPERPMLYIDTSMPGWEYVGPQLVCEDPFYRGHEAFLRRQIWQDEIQDDAVVEPWITQRASYVVPKAGHWGLTVERIRPPHGGAWHTISPIRELADTEKLIVPTHEVDEAKTAADAARLREAIGGILPVHVSRKPFMSVWGSHISGDLGELRGIETVMMDMIDHPEWLHKLLAHLRDGILKVHQEADAAGDWTHGDHENQAVPYADELPAPSAAPDSVPMKQLWCLMAAQEMTLISPEMHDEFMLQYQIPICKLFGLVAYGCCEDLTEKIDILRQIPNLRRIAVTPWAQTERCAEQIGPDYCASWRPSPADMVCCGFDEDRVRTTLREGLGAFAKHNCPAEINLKDVKTLQGEPDRLTAFSRIAREEIARSGG